MDWVKFIYLIILLVCGIFIFIAPFSRKSDERRKFINAKARSYSFTVVIGILILDVMQSIYQMLQDGTSHSGSGGSSLSLMSVILIIYLGTLLIKRKKYGN